LESAAIAILTKAVDFLFTQGAEILKARRERKKTEEGSREESGVATTPLPSPPADSSPAVPEATSHTDMARSRDELLAHEVDQAVLKQNEDEIRHLLALMETHTRNYRLAQKQYAEWGTALVPPVIVNNLDHEERAVAEVMDRLKTKVGEVYGATVSIPGLDDARRA
jgi:hypothetical protein